MTDKLQPKVSVIMNVYNGSSFLEDAIQSVLSQTFTNFELVIVNDGSTDQTGQILDIHKCNSRVVIVTNPVNKGIAASKNIAIRKSKGEYIALMDADDISEPDRLQKQMDYLDSHPDIGVVGAWSRVINDKGELLSEVMRPESDSVIVLWMLLRHCAMNQPTIMLRRNLVIQAGGYNEKLSVSEDYEMWTRLASITKLSNIPEYLVRYRQHDNNISKLIESNYYHVVTSRKFIKSLLNIDISVNILLFLRSKTEHHSTNPFVSYFAAYSLLKIYTAFLRKFCLTPTQRVILRNYLRSNIRSIVIASDYKLLLSPLLIIRYLVY